MMTSEMTQSQTQEPWGLLLLDKPAGMSSHTAINRAVRALSMKKAGHAGTLDPMATGLMLVGIGRATRLLEHLVGCSKTYDATVKLGVSTDTLDREGEVLGEHDASGVSRAEVERVLSTLSGELEQVPPSHSAIKIGGVPLYKRARRGEAVEAPPRRVTVHSIELVEFTPPFVRLIIDCSSGTYIRSIARDMGDALGVGAALWELRRTRCGQFDVEQAVTLDELQGDEAVENVARLLPPARMVETLGRVTLDEEARAAFANGIAIDVQSLDPAEVSSLENADEAAVFSAGEELLGIARIAEGKLKPRKVFA